MTETLIERVHLGEWTTEYMCEMLRLIPRDRYVVVRVRFKGFWMREAIAG